MEREKTLWGDALARLIYAGIASIKGDKDAAINLLSSAEERFRSADMTLYAAAAHRRRGELTGGDGGRNLIAAADEWMKSQQIKNPERMTRMLAPGSW
jgi:eukaryotic-like serine/threonine-protein kinase